MTDIAQDDYLTAEAWVPVVEWNASHILRSQGMLGGLCCVSKWRAFQTFTLG